MREYLLIHVPHSSLYIPEEYKETALISRERLDEENLFMCDYLVDEMILEKDKMVVFPYSRLYCDVERFLDEREVMKKLGMGVMYTKTSLGEAMFCPSLEHEKEVLVIYHEHHRLMDERVRQILEDYGKCVIIDLHSYDSKLVERLFGYKTSPDICLGVDDMVYDKEMIDFLARYFQNAGYTVGINYPYQGTFVPNKYYGKRDTGIISVMIEINKRVYEREINNFKRVLQKCLEQL